MRRSIFFLALVPLALADCRLPCPYYILNASSSSDLYGQARFTNILETDFTLPNSSLTWDSSSGADWQAQTYDVTPSAARGPYGKAAELSDVVLTGQADLQLWVRSQSVLDMIPIAEVVTARNDIMYGSFRISMKTTAVNGTTAAFFFYHNDRQEIDMEFLSRQQQANRHPLNLVLQSPASVTAGDDAAGTPSFVPYSLSFDPTADFHEYRFDWLPGKVDTYADGSWLHSFYGNDSSQAVPDSPGAIHLIHWSNGDPGWSGGPPEQDAVMEVQWVRAWFNASSVQDDQDGCTYDPAACPIPATGGPPPPQASSTASGTGSAGTGGTSTPKHGGSAPFEVPILLMLACSSVALGHAV